MAVIFRCDRCRAEKPFLQSHTVTARGQDTVTSYGLCKDCFMAFEGWIGGTAGVVRSVSFDTWIRGTTRIGPTFRSRSSKRKEVNK
jgi:hypothetical protein